MSDAFEAGNIKGGIELDLATYARNIGIAIAESRRFESEFNGSMQKSQTLATAVGAAIGGVISAGISTATSAAASLVRSLGDTVISGIQLAAQFEQTNISFGVMLGSAERAKLLMAEIQAFAAATPFEFPELAGAARNLLAFGFASEEVVSKLRQLGDLSSALQIPLNDLADIYGKARVQGRLMAEDINQLTGRGIPVIGALAKQFGVAESEVRKLVETGRVGFPELEASIASMTSAGGQFAGMMERQSQSMSGLASTLSDAWSTTQREIGNAISGGEEGKRFITELTAEIEAMRPAIVSIAQAAAEALKSVLPILKNTMDSIAWIVAQKKDIAPARNDAQPSFTENAKKMGTDSVVSVDKVAEGYQQSAADTDAGLNALAAKKALIQTSSPDSANTAERWKRELREAATAITQIRQNMSDASVAGNDEEYARQLDALSEQMKKIDATRAQMREKLGEYWASSFTKGEVEGALKAGDTGWKQSRDAFNAIAAGTPDANVARQRRTALDAARGTEAEAFFDLEGNPIGGEAPKAPNVTPPGSAAGKPEKDPRSEWAAEAVDARLKAAGRLQEYEEQQLARWKAREAEKVKTVEDRQALEQAYTEKLGEVRAKFQERDRAESQKTADKAAAEAQRAADEQARAAQQAADEAVRIARQEQDRLAAMAGGFADLRGADRKAAYEALAGMQTDTTAYTRPLQQQIAATAPAIAPAAVGGSVAAQIQQALPDIAAKVAVAVQGQTNAAGTQQTAALQPIVESIRTTLVKTDTALAATLDLVRQIELRARRGAIAFKEATI